jgi:hypothetical protein
LSVIGVVTHQINRVKYQVGRRRDVFIWAAAILLSNQFFGMVVEPLSSSPQSLISDLGAIGIFQYAAWYAIFRLLVTSDSICIVRWRDLLVVVAFCFFLFLPTSRMIWVGAIGIAIYLWIFNDGDGKLRAAGTVLAALSIQEFWGHIFFNLVAAPMLRAETAVVGTLMEAIRTGTAWHDNVVTGPSGYGIVIYTGCSSFHNISLAMLCWVTVSKLRHPNWRIHDFVIGGVVGVTMIIFNLSRLCLMAWDDDYFYYWHDGFGAEIFAIGASLTILLISLYGSSSVRRLA